MLLHRACEGFNTLLEYLRSSAGPVGEVAMLQLCRFLGGRFELRLYTELDRFGFRLGATRRGWYRFTT